MKTVKITRAEALFILPKGVTLPLRDGGVLLSTGAKLYYRQGTGYFVYGYAYDGSDVDRLGVGTPSKEIKQL